MYGVRLKGTVSKWFRLGGTDGPVLHTDDSALAPSDSDLWLRRLPTPAILQRRSGAWVEIGAGGGGSGSGSIPPAPTTLTGDATGTGTGTIPLVLAASGVTAGTYERVVVDAKGRVTSGSNPTYLTSFADIIEPAVLHVSKRAGVVGTRTGSPDKPFDTVQAAHDFAAANLGSTSHVVLMVAPGVYGETLNLTRPRTHIRGIFGNGAATMLTGAVRVNPAYAVAGMNGTAFCFDDVIFSPNVSDHAFRLQGTIPANIMMRDCRFYMNMAGSMGILADNTGAGGSRLEIEHLMMTRADAQNQVLLDLSNVSVGFIKRGYVYGGAQGAAIFRNGTVMTCDTVTFLATGSASTAVTIAAGASIAAALCLIQNTGANSNGVSVAATGIFSSGYNSFDVTSGTGFAIRGVAGATVLHGYSAITPGKNARISSALGAGNVPVTTSFTAA